MEMAGLLLVLAAIGGVVVVRTIWADTSWTGRAPAAVESSPTFEAPDATRTRTRTRGRRRLLTASALSAALAVDAEDGGRPSFLGRTLAVVRLLLVLLFVCALAGGAIVLVVTTIARALSSSPG
jgi:hypothetical protein